MFTSRTVLLSTVFSFLSYFSFAQHNYVKNEIEGAYGIGIVPEIREVAASFFNAGQNHTRAESITGTGGFCLAYNHYISKRFAIGITAVYSQATVTYHVPSAKLNWSVMSALVNAKYNYVYDPLFHMYSGLSAGCSFSNIIGSVKGSNTAIAYQARIIGARFGAKFGAFAELGFGYEGILKAGVSVQF